MPKLNVGSGMQPLPGYENADLDPAKNPDVLCDMADIPKPCCFYEEVRASHVIEHVPLEHARRALAEWYRVLKAGGKVWIDTPNIRRNLELYFNDHWQRDFATLTPEQQAFCSLNGVPNKTLWLNFKVFSTPNHFDTHYCNYDAELLSDLLFDAGFRQIRVLQEDPSLIIEAQAEK